MSLDDWLLTNSVVASSSRLDRLCDSRRRDHHADSKRRQPITKWHCAVSQNTTDINCAAAKAQKRTQATCVLSCFLPPTGDRRPPAADGHSGEAQRRVALRHTSPYTSRCLAANCRTVTSRPLAWWQMVSGPLRFALIISLKYSGCYMHHLLTLASAHIEDLLPCSVSFPQKRVRMRAQL
jgi:hypothetical protein